MSKIDINRVSLGTDPEYAASVNGVPTSVVGFLPGTKKSPFELSGEGHSCQVDNVGAETCVPPSYSVDEWVYHINKAKQLTQEKLQELLPNAILNSVSSFRYSQKELDSKTAQEFGCEPSFCVYTQGNVSPRPTPEEVGNLRSFGFHVHVGYKPTENLFVFDDIIRVMDIFLGVPSIIIDTDTDRRQIYGNAGDHRFKRVNEELHIVEYRTLGGAMHSSDELLRFVYNQTMKALQFLNDNSPEKVIEISNKTEEIINSGNTKSAIDFCNEMNFDMEEITSLIKTTVCQC